MQISFNCRYKMKDGAEPAFGHIKYVSYSLVPITVDFDDKTVLVCPDGLSEAAQFWAYIDDLEEDI